MKNMNMMVVLAVVALTAVSCGTKQENADKAPKILVLYYSQTSNTKAVAEEIAKKLGADIEEIVPIKPYDGDFQATIERGKQEMEQGSLPEIQPITSDINNYDVVFIGYPVWFGTYAPPIAALLDKTDLSGKKIVPFCTFGSGGLESSANDLKNVQPHAEILSGYGVRAARLEAAPAEIDQFLKANGWLEGENVQFEDFSEQHPVNEEESAVFNAAVDGYPMLHAEAKTVASRAIPNGTEYLFTAIDLPREENSKMPPAGELQVYVTVIKDKTPVFTKVVR